MDSFITYSLVFFVCVFAFQAVAFPIRFLKFVVSKPPLRINSLTEFGFRFNICNNKKGPS